MNMIHRNSVKRNAVSLFLASIFLISILFQGANQPSSLFNESSNTTTLNSPPSANIDYEQSITGAGNNRSVRLFMDNSSSTTGINNFNISSDNSDNYLNEGQYNFTISKNYNTNYTLEDDTPLEYPFDENIPITTHHGFAIPLVGESSVSNSLILNTTAEFANGVFEENILGFQIEMDLTCSDGFNLSVLMKNNDSLSYELLETYSSDAISSQVVKIYVRNENLLYLNSTDDAEFSFKFTNDDNDFTISIASLSITAVEAQETQIYDGNNVALEFDTKGEATIFGFYAWIRSFNTTDSAYAGNLTIQLYEANSTTDQRRSEIILEADQSLIIPETLLMEYTIENYTSDKPTWFTFGNDVLGEEVGIGNYYIVISSNVSKDVDRCFSLVTIDEETVDDKYDFIDHLLLNNGTGNWELISDNDAALFAVNLTRAYLPEEIDLQIENHAVSDTYTFDDSVLFNTDSDVSSNEKYYASNWWGCGTIDHTYNSPIPTSDGKMQVNLTWNTDIYSGPIDFNVSFDVQKYFDDNATTTYNLTLGELPAWSVNYTYDSSADRFVNWTLMEAWYFIPLDWEVTDFIFNSSSYLANITDPTTVNEQQVIKVQELFINTTGSYELQATSVNYIKNIGLNLNYEDNLWPSNGFMIGDNVSISVGILDSENKYLSSGIVTASLFNTSNTLDSNYILTDNSIDENTTFSTYLFDSDNCILSNASSEGEYNVLVNWTNGEQAGILKRSLYVNHYEIPAPIDISYQSASAANQITAPIRTFDTDINNNEYSIYLYAVRENSAEENQIDKETNIQMGQNVYLTNYLQNETFFNAGEDVNISIDLENRHASLNLDVDLTVQLVYKNNIEMIIEEVSSMKSLAIYGSDSDLDKQQYNFTLSIPTVLEGGINCPIRNSPMKINIIAEIDGDEIYSGLQENIIYYSELTESSFDGEILEIKEYSARSGPAFIGNMERTNLNLPETVSYFIQVENGYLMTCDTEEMNLGSEISKLDGQITNLAFTQTDFDHSSTINFVGKAIDEYGEPLSDISLNLYYDNTPSNDTDDWKTLSTLAGATSITTDSEGNFDVEINLLQTPISTSLELKVEFVGSATLEALSNTIKKALPEYDTAISISIDSDQTMIANTDNILNVRITNLGNTVLKNISVESEFDFTEILVASSFDLLVLSPYEKISFQIILNKKSFENDTISFNFTVGYEIEETGEILVETKNVEFATYSVNENKILITSAVVVFIVGAALFWIYGAIYIKKKKEEIDAPVETISDVKNTKRKRRVGKYVPISELSTKSDEVEEVKEESTTSLDDLLDEK